MERFEHPPGLDESSLGQFQESDGAPQFYRLVAGVAVHGPSKPLPVSCAAAVTAQVCTVLSRAHAVPVVHRDLKPANTWAR
ncbi:hypothetical protein ACH4VM_35995 [Streptomyces sp. NPDC020792]|uniref:hypothetical protein n=1 Tax=Streptomyces sp. NPDC020792 TaxID=3365089 RepID=UPI0037A85FF3